MIRLYFLSIFLFMGITVLFGQFNETIRTDRPGQSIGAYSAGKGFFQIQSGFDFFDYNNSVSRGNGLLSNTVIRYGLTEPFEVSAMIEYKGKTQISILKMKMVSVPLILGCDIIYILETVWFQALGFK
jgi:hypothetical protein